MLYNDKINIFGVFSRHSGATSGTWHGTAFISNFGHVYEHVAFGALAAIIKVLESGLPRYVLRRTFLS